MIGCVDSYCDKCAIVRLFLHFTYLSDKALRL